MTVMTEQLENMILSSLSNPQHDWHVNSTATHETPPLPGLTLSTGGLQPQSVTGPASPPVTSITYQLQSEPLDLIMVFMAELVDDVFDHLTVYYRGTTFTTDNVSIYTAVAAMAAPEVNTTMTEFQNILGQQFGGSALSFGSSVTAVGTKT